MKDDSRLTGNRLNFVSATEEDSPFLFELFCEIRRSHFTSLGLPQEQLTALLDLQFRAQRDGYKAQYPKARTEIILVDGEPAGQWILAENAEFHCLVDISICSRMRNRGIGSRALAKALKAAREKNVPLRAHVANDNPRAKELWLRSGLRIVGQDESYTALESTP